MVKQNLTGQLLVADKLTPSGCGDLLCAIIVVVGFAA
jgi:hypothetical protein